MHKTVRCGLIGHPVAHSRSPEIHHAFAKQIGMILDYTLIDAVPEKFSAKVQAFFASGGHGLNVTVPHKAAAFAMADEAGNEAQRSGVANTLTALSGGRVRADNTDGTGLVRDLTCNLAIKLVGMRVLIVGAGGAASGILPALLDSGVDGIVITNRTSRRAGALVTRLGDRRLLAATLDALSNTSAFDLVINATSASLQGERPKLPEATIGNKTLACDLVYADRPTPFMDWAKKLGARTRDGWNMLIEQAADSFHLWHGIRPDTTSPVAVPWTNRPRG